MVTIGAECASTGSVFGLKVRDKIKIIADELVAAAIWVLTRYRKLEGLLPGVRKCNRPKVPDLVAHRGRIFILERSLICAVNR